MASPIPIPPPSALQVERCRELVFAAAIQFHVPPAYVTAHVRSVPADLARRVVMIAMLEMGISRGHVAKAFGRDRRRVRRSVLGA